MKYYFKVCLITLFSLAVTSCSKNDDSNSEAQTENPLESYLTQADYGEDLEFIDAGHFELGFVFSPQVDGYMTGITVRLPDSHPNLRVTLWNFDSEEVIYTNTFNVTQANTITEHLVNEIVLEKNKKYIISMNTDDYYYREREYGMNVSYPIIAGNIKIFEARERHTYEQLFPNYFSRFYNVGDVSFNFKPF